MTIPALTLQRRLVLASGSPRRKALLRAAGLSFDVRVADIDETPHHEEHPPDLVTRLARSKAEAVACHQNEVIVGSDTIVALGDRVLGKPESIDEAAATLRELSGRTHLVRTAVAIRDANRLESFVVDTEVRFRALRHAEIAAYIETGEPMDKAGCYGIQGEGGALTASVSGSYTNVVGLPLEETLALLATFGVTP